MGCPWGRGGVCQALLAWQSVLGWLDSLILLLQSLPSQRLPRENQTFIPGSLSSALTFPFPLFLHSQYIFVDAFAPYLWITTDFCNTIQGFSIPFRAADLLLHSRNPNLLLGFDRSHPKKQVGTLLRWDPASQPCLAGSSWGPFCPPQLRATVPGLRALAIQGV